MEFDVERIHGGHQDAVHPKLDRRGTVRGFDMDVARSALHGAEHNGVEQLDHRALVLTEVIDGEHFFAPLVLPDQHRSILRFQFAAPDSTLTTLQRSLDGAPRTHHICATADSAGFPTHPVRGDSEGSEIAMVRTRLILHRDERMPSHQLHGDGVIKLRVDSEIR